MVQDFRLDEAALARLRRIGGDGFLRRSIDRFLEYAPKKVESLRTGLEAGDLRTVERAAHMLKPSAGNFGADRLMALAERIELLAAAGEAEPLPPLVAEFEELFVQVRRCLEAERSRLGA